MSAETEHVVWLETNGGSRIPIQGNCSIGRSTKNTIVTTSDRVSRRHALIHVQDNGEFWLVDLGSTNGTFLNERRISQPMKLRDRDRIGIGADSFVFRQNENFV